MPAHPASVAGAGRPDSRAAPDQDRTNRPASVGQYAGGSSATAAAPIRPGGAAEQGRHHPRTPRETQCGITGVRRVDRVEQQRAGRRDTAADDHQVQVEQRAPRRRSPGRARPRPAGRRPARSGRRPARHRRSRPTGPPSRPGPSTAGRGAKPCCHGPPASEVPLAMASRQPTPPHTQCGPFGSTLACPMWPALPVAPTTTRPFSTNPPPTPVDTTMPSTLACPRAAPRQCSPTATATASPISPTSIW